MFLAETHKSEDLTVNQCWDVRSDVYFVVFRIFGFGKKLDLNVEVDLSELCISLINNSP